MKYYLTQAKEDYTISTARQVWREGPGEEGVVRVRKMCSRLSLGGGDLEEEEEEGGEDRGEALICFYRWI